MDSILHKEYTVVQDDYVNAGKVSSDIKTTLSEIGISPKILRKIAVASYESEINLIIMKGEKGHSATISRSSSAKNYLKDQGCKVADLIADKEVVPELVADAFTHKRLMDELSGIMPGLPGRKAMLEGYGRMREAIGKPGAPANAARLMVSILNQ